MMSKEEMKRMEELEKKATADFTKEEWDEWCDLMIKNSLDLKNFSIAGFFKKN